MIITRYIYKQLYSNLLVITLVLLAIFTTNQFVHYLRHAADGSISMLAVFKVMTLQIPMLLGYIIPLAFYLSILTVIGRLCLDSEMTVLHACGMSLAQLTRIIMGFSFIVSLLVAWLMIFAEPSLSSYHQMILAESAAKLSVHKILPSKFTNLKHGRVIYASKVHRDQQTLQDVFFAQKQTSDKPNTLPSWNIIFSTTAVEQNIAKYKGDFLIFNHGSRYVGTPGKNDFQVTQFDHYGLLLNPGILHENLWPNNGTLLQLWYARNKDRDAASLFHWRIAMPISVLLFGLLAIPLSHVSPRQGKFARFFPAMIIYIAYANLLFVGRAWIQNGTVSPTMGLWWIHGLALVLALGLYLWQIGMTRIKAFIGFSK